MPLYSFKCECGHEFESIERHDKLLTNCPRCGRIEGAVKQISAPGGYKITGNNSASTPPRGGAFKKGRR